MPLMNITVPHELSREEATDRLTKKLDQIKQDKTYTITDLSETWPDPNTMEFAFKVFGFSLTGSVKSLEHAVNILVDLPVAAMPLQSTIESQTVKELNQLLT